MSNGGEIALIIAGLTAMVIAASMLPGVLRVLLIGQSVYWGMSYVARPLVLLSTRPAPHFGDNVADPRLASLGYDRAIAGALQPVVYGVGVYAALVVALAIWVRYRGAMVREVPMAGHPAFCATLGICYVVGSLGRAASVAAGTTAKAGEVETSSPILALVTLLASIGSLGLIALARPARGAHTVLLIAGLMAGELLWTVAIESKTPIMGAALAVAVRFALTGWNRAKAAGVAAISVIGIGAFGWLQSLKESPYLKSLSTEVNSSYPPAVQPFLSLLRRFDLLEAATDAYYAGPHSWLTPGQVVQHGLTSLLPAQVLGAPKMQAGTAWASEVRGASVDMNGLTVSLAEGNVNEGYVLGGYAGVTVGVVFTFVVLLLWAAALYSRRVVPVVLGLALSEIPVVFERGILGTFEVVGKYLQAVVLVWLIYQAVLEYQRRRRSLVPATGAMAIAT
ncbi:hypothetical protein [Nocardia sp. NPDC052566]|uniref:hypothetical protein n=1 Tax=Nocardia sp. NPDC052566 TaxID=3364330 RepID=UPI0037C7B662